MRKVFLQIVARSAAQPDQHVGWRHVRQERSVIEPQEAAAEAELWAGDEIQRL
jgi:hypothetical protein